MNSIRAGRGESIPLPSDALEFLRPACILLRPENRGYSIRSRPRKNNAVRVGLDAKAGPNLVAVTLARLVRAYPSRELLGLRLVTVGADTEGQSVLERLIDAVFLQF